MNDSENICLSCGLCCDGTLIGFVQLDREELPSIKKLMNVEEANGNGVFLHPCESYCDGCTIYSERPRQCGLFECKLLKSYEQKELSFNSATEIIDSVIQKRDVIEKTIATLPLEFQSQSFYFKMIELKKHLQKNKVEATLDQNLLKLTTDIEQLDLLLIEKFDVSLS